MLKFSNEHIWIDEIRKVIGISDHAQKSLGDIVFIDFPEIGNIFEKDQQFGSVESVKSVSPLFAPVTMRVLEINEILESQPETMNSEPYGEGWIIKIEVIEDEELKDLMIEKDYLDWLINKS